MPGNDNGCYEDFDDALVMIRNSDKLMLFTVLYVLCITGYNVCAIFITFLLESVWRSILEVSRHEARSDYVFVIFQLVAPRRV